MIIFFSLNLKSIFYEFNAMLIKLGIIVSVIVLGGMIFSTEITSLFPNTSALLADSLKDDITSLNAKVTDSAENRLDSSIDKTIQSVSDSVYEGITDTGDKLVENVNEKISEGITDTQNTIKNEILESSTSSTEVLVNEVSGFDPFSFFKDLFKIN